MLNYLMPNDPNFELLRFPKDIVEVYMKGGPQPALVVMRKQYGRAKPGWCERAIEWLEKNLPRGPEYTALPASVVMFKPGDLGLVTIRGEKPKPGAQTVRVEQVLNQGRVLRVVDPLTNREHYVMSDMLAPKAPTPQPT